MPQAMHLVWLHCFWDSKQAAPGDCLKKRALILSIISWIDSQSTRSKNPQYIPVFCGCCCSIALKLDVSVIYYALHRRMLPTASWGNTDTVSAMVKSYELFWVLSTIMQVKEISWFYLPVLNEIPCLLLCWELLRLSPPTFEHFSVKLKLYTVSLKNWMEKRVNLWSGTQRSHLPFPCTDFWVKIE